MKLTPDLGGDENAQGVDFHPFVWAYFREHSLVDAQIKSLNQFLSVGVQEVIDSLGEIELIEGYKLLLGKVELGQPEITEYDGSKGSITPMEARLRKLTYQAPIYLEVKVYGAGMELSRERVKIGYMPTMVKSDKCVLYGLTPDELVERGEDPLDPGGYFIVNGSERVLVMRDDIAPNKIVVEEKTAKSKTYSHVGQVISARAGFRSRLFLEYYPRDGTIKASFWRLSKIPVLILVKALGIEKDEDVLKAISSDEEISNKFIYGLDEAQRKLGKKKEEETARELALDYIGRRLARGAPRRDRIAIARDLLQNRFLIHIGTSQEDNLKKAYYLTKMIEKLIKVMSGAIPPDDRDHFSNKRLRLAGDLMQEAFRYAFYQLVTRMRRKGEALISSGVYEINLRRLISGEGHITSRMMSCLSTGIWPRGELGISQNLDRTNYIATLQHLRRVNSPLPSGLPLHEARQIHGTSVGRLCPLETPEGTNVGLVRSLATFTDITFGTDPEPVAELLYKLEIKPIGDATPEEVGLLTPIYLNGNLMGVTDSPARVVDGIRGSRDQLDPEINLVHHEDENVVVINADGGRPRRPLISANMVDEAIGMLDKVRRGELTFSELIKRGVVELLDADEEETALIAHGLPQMGPEHTHLDFAPYMMFGVAAGEIPFAEHNAIPRDIIGGNMVRQGIGPYATNWRLRMDSRSFLLNYPHRPMVRTRIEEVDGYNVRPSGQNLVVALIPMDGYNMDDALIMNRSSIDRGAARGIFFRTYEAVARRQAIVEGDRFENPYALEGVMGKREEDDYKKLAEDGVVDLEVGVEGGDVLIGKTSPPRFSPELIGAGGVPFAFERRDTSVSMRAWETGTVSDVVLATTIAGERMARISVRDTRLPEMGDKFATRHGQKGVVGMIYRQEDMPFTESGITPDVILDPHAIPSRMTIGQLIEILAAKVASLEGRLVDGTPFVSERLENLEEALEGLGFDRSGKEIMYDGRTGKKVNGEIFIGVSFYQKLKHMVRNKIHARPRGQVQVLTRQPVEGRARGGGLRLGEMENEVLFAHGAAASIQDRCVENSDKTLVYVCKRCGSILYFNSITNSFFCPRCRESVEVRPLVTSYASILFIQELMTGLVDVKLRVEEGI